SLQSALRAYLAGYKLGLNPDGGAYTGLNAAFVLDLLADRASDDVAVSSRRAQAEQIRQDIINVLLPLAQNSEFKPDKWYYAKLGEAYLGIGRYELARNCMVHVAHGDLSNWELETMARQLSLLTRLQAGKEGKEEEQLEKSE